MRTLSPNPKKRGIETRRKRKRRIAKEKGKGEPIRHKPAKWVIAPATPERQRGER